MLLADGELEPSRAVEVENHLTQCSPCREELELIRSMRASLRRSCARRGTEDARLRVEKALAVEASGIRDARSMSTVLGDAVVARQIPAASSRASRATMVVVLAAAACFVFFVVARARQGEVASSEAPHDETAAANDDDKPTGEPVNENQVARGSDLDFVLDQLVALHANPLPPEEQNPEKLSRLEPYVGVPVQKSAMQMLRRNDRIGAVPSFDGARLHMVENSHNAAALHYKVKGHRLTVYVFDARSVQMRHTRLKHRVVREENVWVGQMRGFTVAAAERRGVGYALASDLDEDNNVQMVASF